MNVVFSRSRSDIENGLIPVVRWSEGATGPATFGLVERMQRYAVPGAAVAVLDDDGIAWTANYGVRHASRATPVDDTTLFQAASISKAVAAVAVLALVEHGVLDLDEDVLARLGNRRPLVTPVVTPDSQDLPEWHDQPITLRRLLSHTAGLTVPGFPGYRIDEAMPSVLDVLNGSGTANTPALQRFAPPGSIMQYSGGGTTLVQYLVTEVTGRPFTELMDELVLRPFSMHDSVFRQPLPARLGSRAATGHDANGGPVPGGHHNYPELQAAGLWTTAADLARWLLGVRRILAGDRSGPISPDLARLMVTAVEPGTFGLGPELAGTASTDHAVTDRGSGTMSSRRFGHSGSNEGFRSLAEALIDGVGGFAVLTNGAGGTALSGEIRRAVAAAQGWGPVDEITIEPVETPIEVLEACTGGWVGPFDLRMRIDLIDGVLSTPAPYGRRHLIATGDRTFVDEETGATLVLTYGNGESERMAVLAGGVEIMAFERDDHGGAS